MVVAQDHSQISVPMLPPGTWGKEPPRPLLLGLMDMEPTLFEVEVLDAQRKGFTDARAVRLEQMNNEARGIVVSIRNDR